MLPDIDYDIWKGMGRPQSPLTIFERVMKAGHDPKSNRITFDKCKCGGDKFAYSDSCINCTHEAMKRLFSNDNIKSFTIRR